MVIIYCSILLKKIAVYLQHCLNFVRKLRQAFATVSLLRMPINSLILSPGSGQYFERLY
jgi:hypothetical protein